MGLEQRGRRRYYYRKRREGAKVVSEYRGTGAIAEALAALDRCDQLARVRAQALVQTERQERRDHERQLRHYYDQVRAVLRLALLAAGYHQHKRQWRKARMDKALGAQTREIEPWAFEAWRAAMQRSANPEQIKDFEAALREFPQLARLAGDLGRVAIRQILVCEEQTPAVNKSIEAVIERMRAELGADNAPFIERMLIDQITVAWLDYYLLHLRYTQATSGSHELSKGLYWDKRVTAAQKRYLRAVETLARVRKLGISIQVNIAGPGGQQVNVG